MNHGPLIFLAAFLGLAASWFGLVLAPQAQLGQLQPTNAVPGNVTYPVARPGLARQGLEVYRANGCAYCHSQQVGQTGTTCDVMLTEAGTNQAAATGALMKLTQTLTESEARSLLGGLPKSVLQGQSREAADSAVKTLKDSGAKASVWIVPTGPDIARGWGKRRTVAEDYLYDDPVMLGEVRIGPDLANAGVRLPDENWHLRHLYAPAREVKGSTMPPYRFLFERRRIERQRSAGALPPEFDPEPGYEIVPLPEARALAAYLTSLRADAPLFVAPFSLAAAAPDTNAPSAGSTNAAPATPAGAGAGAK